MLKQKNLLIATILVATALLTGCSKSDGFSTSKTSGTAGTSETNGTKATNEINATGDRTPDQEVIVINGHTLPPEPDPAVNNATLLGVDSNDNGVRDDVERWIYTTYDKPIEQAVLMQSARAYQVVIQEPEKALDNLPIMQAATACESYWSLKAKREGEPVWIEKYRNYSKEMRPIQFNTSERYLAFEQYNQILSGGVYSLVEGNKMKSKCDFNISNFVKGL